MFNVQEIDRQHQELIGKLNRLNDAVSKMESRETIYQMIDDVIEYTRLHFATEEELMLKSGYPLYEAHKEKHKELIQDALNLKKKLAFVGEEMFTEWFNHWPFARVLAHIQYADSQIENHILRSHGNCG